MINRKFCIGMYMLVAVLLSLGLAVLAESFKTERLPAAPLNHAHLRDTPHPLTPLGQTIKRVVISAMLPGVCQSSDWRGELARWMARFLPDIKVVVWEARRWRNGRQDGGESIKCRVCRNPDSIKRVSSTYDCPSLEKLGKGDLVIVVGTGNVACAYKPFLRDLPQCKVDRLDKAALPSIQALDHTWDKENVVAVHFPVRALNALTLENNIFGFNTIIEDDSFFKPMGGKGEIADEMNGCHRRRKSSDLLYVARYKEHKGQLKFVEQADPFLLRGYTIHFYGGGATDDAAGKTYYNAIIATARSKGIRVQLNNHVAKSDLMHHMCTAAGQILWPKEDSNPRAAYEGLYAGMPLFISTTAGVPNPLLEQNFVQPVPCNSTVDEFNRNLTKFMSIVKEHQKSSYLRRKIIKYTQTALDPENVYWELCQRMGICGQRDEPLSEEDDYESQEERAPTTDAGEDQSNLDTVDEHGGTQTGSTFWNRNPHSTRR